MVFVPLKGYHLAMFNGTITPGQEPGNHKVKVNSRDDDTNRLAIVCEHFPLPYPYDVGNDHPKHEYRHDKREDITKG
jgi:hypothetical protein